jgi:hypothetical protein
VEGTILILGPPEIEKAGFFKTEFLEHLKKLPRWEKTAYYCHSHAVFRCETGARVSLPEKEGVRKRSPSGPAKAISPGRRLHSSEKKRFRSHQDVAWNYVAEKVGGMVDRLKLWCRKIRSAGRMGKGAG